MKYPWTELTPEERKAAMMLRRRMLDEREAEFYRIHGKKKGRPKKDNKK